MNILNNLIGGCVNFKSQSENDFFDLQSLVNKLLLFDKFILQSPNLFEIPYIVKAFGFDGTLELLSSGALRISCEAFFISQVAQTNQLVPGGKTLPLGNYCIKFGYPKRTIWFSDQMKRIRTNEMSNSQYKKLKLAVVNALERKYLQDSDFELLQQTNNDLASNRYIKRAALLVLNKEKKYKVNSDDFYLKLHQTDEQFFRAESNLGEIFSLDEIEVHKIIEQAVYGIAGLNCRIFTMKIHHALSGFLESEAPLYGDKLEFLIEECNPNKLEGSFDRVIKLKNFPDITFDSSKKVDVNKLIKVRSSNELREFREWLKKTDLANDAELLDQINNKVSKLGIFAQILEGKMLRIVVPNLASFIPGLGGLTGFGLGVGLGAADTFVVEKLIPYSGTVAFIDKLYPSIFKTR